LIPIQRSPESLLGDLGDQWIQLRQQKMNYFKRFIKRLFSKKRDPEIHNAGELRLEFKARNHNFKLLLNANNSALENMAQIEKALMESDPFSFAFVKAKSTAIAVDVFRMIRNLHELCPDKYANLSKKFKVIEQDIVGLLTSKRSVSDERLVIPLGTFEPGFASLTGSKMANLSEIKNRLQIKVPEAFSITAFGYRLFKESNYLNLEIDRRFQSADYNDLESLGKICEDIQQLILDAQIPPVLATAIEAAYAELEQTAGSSVKVAMRSSALGEDMQGSSFAGQYHTELNVRKENLLQVYKRIVASKYSLTAVCYRYNFGYRDEDVPMSVGCMVIVDAIAGGVMYTQSPMDDKKDFIQISSTWGLTISVVDGKVACDQYVVSKSDPGKIIQEDIREKQIKTVCSATEGLSDRPLEAGEKNASSLTHAQLRSLAELAIKLENYYKSPLDIEWGFTDEPEPYVLQCRLLQKVQDRDPNQPTAPTPDKKDLLLTGGITASPGIICGPVFQVNKIDDVLAFPPGAILVTKEARPKWAPLLKDAAGVITTRGGFAGHLATVAREFGVPAIFNLENALDQLQNGHVIILDADNSSVYHGYPERLIPVASKRKNLMADSPVYKTLEKISRLIVPLNLLDPESADFRPSNCNTLHDITRFIHEKSLLEMFNFGQEHDFSERSSKQLIYKVPMQWWVLNLDDGFKDEKRGKYVHMENIASIPMLALWEGIIAIPWDGPPPIDGRGLLSVMFQATTNTNLNTGVRSAYNEKNYFMISKNFCSLTTRLGFHFSTIEAMVSEKQEENYISFLFKGGAADAKRRTKRVMFLGNILEENHFNIRIREDSLIARLENQTPDFIINHLKILGYLTIHARQIDMIMSNEATVNYYNLKLRKDIKTLTSS